MALHRRAVLSSIIAVAVAGCVNRGSPKPEATVATEPSYADCDPEAVRTPELHTAGEIPALLSGKDAAEYAKALETDLVLPPPEERNQGYVSFGDVTVEEAAYGYLVTVPVTGGYQREDPPGTATGTHADLGSHVAAYFINQRVVRRAVDRSGDLDPREDGEIVVCEAT